MDQSGGVVGIVGLVLIVFAVLGVGEALAIYRGYSRPMTEAQRPTGNAALDVHKLGCSDSAASCIRCATNFQYAMRLA
jgi:hypothetical protein